MKSELKLKEFNTINCSCKNVSKGATIKFYKSGNVVFSKEFMKMIGFSIGNKISFYQDQDSPRRFLIGESENGFELKIQHNRNNSYFASKALYDKIKYLLNIQSDIFIFVLGKRVEEQFPTKYELIFNK